MRRIAPSHRAPAHFQVLHMVHDTVGALRRNSCPAVVQWSETRRGLFRISMSSGARLPLGFMKENEQMSATTAPTQQNDDTAILQSIVHHAPRSILHPPAVSMQETEELVLIE